MNKTIFIIIIFTAIIFLTGFIFMNFPKTQIKTLKIGDKSYQVEIVSSEQDQIKGLSDRDNLDNLDGMLFIYPDSQIRSFWMKNMKFDLDIIWINGNKIIGFAENISYQDQEKSYVSPAECDMVLELPSGQIKKDNLQIGDKVELK